MSRQRHLLLIDDELSPKANSPGGNYMWYYVRALRDSGYLVTEVARIDEAVDELVSDASRFDLILLDVLMEPGQWLGDQDTQQGTRTGWIAADRFADLFPGIPIVILTNFRHTNSGHVRQNKSIRAVLSKIGLKPFELVDEVNRLLGT